jgi:hypothetical protein
MIWSDLYLVTYVWLIVHELNVYVYVQNESNKQYNLKSCEFTREDCFFLSSNSYWEKAKRAQFNVLFQNIT